MKKIGQWRRHWNGKGVLRQEAFGEAGKADGSGLVGLTMAEFRLHRLESIQGDQDDLMNAHVNLQFDSRT